MAERFVELLGDEESDVQGAAINSLVRVFQKLPADQARATVLPILTRILQTCQGPVMQTFLYQSGKICDALVNLGLFPEVEDDLMLLIQRSFIDSGNKVEDEHSLLQPRGMNLKTESDYEFSEAQENLVSEW